MAMSSQPGYWIWDDRHKDYYHAQINAGTGPNPPSQPPPQPVDPYGAAPSTNASRSGNYVYSNSYRAPDIGSLTYNFGQLSTSGSYGAYAQPGTAPVRMNTLGPGYGSSPASNTIDPMPPFSPEAKPNTLYGSHSASAVAASKQGSSLEAQTSSASYIEHDSRTVGTALSAPIYRKTLDPGALYPVAIQFTLADVSKRISMSEPNRTNSLWKANPILTYRGKGAAKKGVDQNAHAVIYTGSRAPDKQVNEYGMKKSPLQVVPVRPDEKLDSMSRVNLGKTYTIEWNTKVKEIGYVEQNSLVKMITYWKKLMDT
ncbi:MAG: hypothetical protein Q9170_003727 [Blastenia crenularia]